MNMTIGSAGCTLDDTATRDSKGFAEQAFSFPMASSVWDWKGRACGTHEWGTPLRLDETSDIEPCKKLAAN